MTQRLFTDTDSVLVIRSTLERVGYDIAQETLRPDYFTSPFPNYESFVSTISNAEPALRTALQLLSLGQPTPVEFVAGTLGRDFLEAALACGLLLLDESGDQVSTQGLSLVSRLGLYFVVSTNPYYPGFNPRLADIYLGPDSLTLVNHLQRQASGLAASGRALDVCAGSGIAGQSIGSIRRGLEWTAVDLSPLAVEAATFNALLNGMQGRYGVREGNLFEPVPDQRFALIIANPPFIPVPEGVDFPVYGAGGEDGLSVVRPLLRGIAGRLTEQGRAIVYTEGIGTDRGPVILDVLEELAGAGYAIGVTLLATMNAEQTLFSIGRLLAAQKPSRLDELSRWTESFASQRITRYDKMIVDIRPGTGGLVIRSVTATGA